MLSVILPRVMAPYCGIAANYHGKRLKILDNKNVGAMTLSLTTFSTTTLSRMTLSITIKNVTLSIMTLSFIAFNTVMLSVIYVCNNAILCFKAIT